MDELNNALAWVKAAPANFYKSGKEKLEGTAQWIWEVIQGDFNDEQSTAQMVTGTVISMIPLVDQICDVRDVVANCKKIKEDSSNTWHWVALALTLIGLFPTLGSFVKGSFKVLFAYGRKGVFSAGTKALDADMWKATKPFVEAGIAKLNDFLARPEVRRTLQALKIDNPYIYLAGQLRSVSAKLNVGALTSAMDEIIGTLKGLTDKVLKWGPASLHPKVLNLLAVVDDVRKQANKQLGQVIDPLTGWLEQLARRLDVEHKQRYEAKTNTLTPHTSLRMSLDAELEMLRKAPPPYVKVGKKGRHPAIEEPPAVPTGHCDIGPDAPKPLKAAFRTFSDVRADVLPPGTTIYRLLDPKSNDNSICWLTAKEFYLLRSKADWYDRLAVWKNWNGNGEYLSYTVPPGKGLPVWRGTTASQPFKDANNQVVKANAQGDAFWVAGGAEQLVVNPADLQRASASARKPTNWLYGEGDIDANLIGVPPLNTNWRE